MGELDMRVPLGYLGPEPPDPEPFRADVGVVEQDHAPRAYLGQPGGEVVLHRLVGVVAVDMEDVDGPIFELAHRLVEGGLDQG